MRKIPPLKTNVFIPQCIYLICLLWVCFFWNAKMTFYVGGTRRWHCVIIVLLSKQYIPPLKHCLVWFCSFCVLYELQVLYWCHTVLQCLLSCIEMPCTVSFTKKTEKKNKNIRSETDVWVTRALCIDSFLVCTDELHRIVADGDRVAF